MDGRRSGAPEVDEAASRSIAAVERAMDVLLLFGRSGRPDLGITEIAQELGLTKAAVHRILTALRTRRLVSADPTTRRYALGPAAVALGRAYLARTDLRLLAAPELRRLADECGETATLSVRRGDTRLYVDQVVPAQELRIEVALGTPYPLHAGASSKVMLAFLRDAEVDDYLAARDLEALTPKTVTDPVRLRRELAAIRKRGYATSSGERQDGAAAVAAPVLDHDGVMIASLSVSGPQTRFRGRLVECAPFVVEAAARLSAEFGYGATGA
ncbi:IclR family transcriptional regulator [Yinghuangia seranimata]|uniref:IclR family transcriptional regulator n=1 Tax=Yinghuangia seranimata TaxID=408067 RepID=UPI00248C2A2A|nr:IclR family transcriptional regulator [Yinghuangia seranimata]MDI2131650.1 IclR family transcriptional regulator [Yinghuangia seranimata]